MCLDIAENFRYDREEVHCIVKVFELGNVQLWTYEVVHTPETEPLGPSLSMFKIVLDVECVGTCPT